MNLIIDLPILMTAFFAGLLGSGHCFGMCGGIAAGLGSLPAKNEGFKQPRPGNPNITND